MLKKTFKTEVKLNQDQSSKFFNTWGVCRYVYNQFIEVNKTNYENGGETPYMSGYTFSKWLNENIGDRTWIKEVSSKSVKNSIMNADRAYKNFMRGSKGFPKFKSKYKDRPSMYFTSNGKLQPIEVERHRVKIPTLGWVHINEKNYIPTGDHSGMGTLVHEAGRFYVSVTIDMPKVIDDRPYTEGIGIDLGVQTLAVVSNGDVYENINKSNNVKKLKKKIKRAQRNLSRKLKNKKKGSNLSNNTKKDILKLQKAHRDYTNFKKDYINKMVNKITVRTKPEFIVMENLAISNMVKNRHLSRVISDSNFYEIKIKIKIKSENLGIRFIEADRFYPSSKTCSVCGEYNPDLKLKDRVFICSNGHKIDRDLNAALNLRNLGTV